MTPFNSSMLFMNKKSLTLNWCKYSPYCVSLYMITRKCINKVHFANKVHSVWLLCIELECCLFIKGVIYRWLSSQTFFVIYIFCGRRSTKKCSECFDWLSYLPVNMCICMRGYIISVVTYTIADGAVMALIDRASDL